MIWAALAFLTLLVLALVLRPLLFAGKNRVADETARLAIYRDQLKELAREQEDGLLGAEEEAAVRLEIERRMLATGAVAPPPPAASLSRRLSQAVPLALLLVAGPLALYLGLGQPTVPDQPFAARDRNPQMPDIATALARLRAHLAEQPSDIEGWALLARSEMNIGAPDEAADAYAHAIENGADQPPERLAELNSAQGEAQVQAAGGTVGPAAKRSFEAALALAPRDPRAHFYLALAREQDGDQEGALADYLALINSSPADAPWQGAVHEKALQMATALGRDPAPLGLERPPGGGPSAAEMAEAAAGKNPAEQKQMIETMVAGLAEKLKASPDDIDGWMRLGRSYGVLGERDKARDALGEAAKRAPDRMDVLVAYAHTIYAPEDTNPPPAEFIDIMRHVLTLDPSAPEALWFVGNAEASAGNAREARDLFDKLLTLLPPDAPARATVQSRIDGLRAGPRRTPGG